MINVYWMLCLIVYCIWLVKARHIFFVGISLLYSKAISQDSIHTLSAPEKEMVPRSVFTESVLTDRIVTSGCRCI